MPIVDIQSQFRELGRIRTGILEKPQSGKPRPKKLATFRLTSKWRHLLDELAVVFGGTVSEWKHPSEEGLHYELVTESAALDVFVPPGDVLSQWYELWSGGGCQRRCDGVRQTLQDRPCACPADPAERAERASAKPPTACKPTSRLIVMLPQAGDLGVWRLESHGFYAAVELAGAAGLVEIATRRGIMVPAVLRLEQRSRKVPGQPVKRFAVPALSFRGNLGETLEALGFAHGDLPVMPGVEPRPALDTGGAPALEAAPAAIPTPADLADLDEFGVERPTEEATLPPADTPEPEAFEPPAREPDAGEAAASLSWAQMAAMRAGEAGLDDEGRHGVYAALTGGRTTKGAELEPQERTVAMATFVRLRRGDAVLARSEAGTWALIGRGTGIEATSSEDFAEGTIVAGPADLIGRQRRFGPVSAPQSPPTDSEGPVTPEVVDEPERST